MQHYQLSAFIFHRDLRLHDNTGLIQACKLSKKVIPCFIFTPEQVGPDNAYKSDNALQFMIESLQDLEQQLKNQSGKLYLFFGNTQDSIKKLINSKNIDAVFFNKDYTPFAQKRDKAVAEICDEHSVACHAYDDALLNSPGTVLTQSDEPYKMFTPFWKTSITLPVKKDVPFDFLNFYTKAIDSEQTDALYANIVPKPNPNIAVHGGRKNAIKIVKKLKTFDDYQEKRDIPAHNTTLLSASNKFGTLSIRELYWQMKKQLGKKGPPGLIRQLYWRDFYYHIAYFFPHVFGKAFVEKYQTLTWSKSKKNFERWCTGTTGFPIVDAGMRQLNTSGWMHNRTRMIVASFLVKDLHINWLWGERYFAQKLVDYDPCVNNGNWQWAASTGCDAQPYFRIFNPWLQQKKFDPACTYIKRWVAELAHTEPKIIHNEQRTEKETPDYPTPMLDHRKEKEIALAQFKKAS